MPMPSAPSEIIAIDGVHRIPMLGPVRTRSGTSSTSAAGHGSSAIARPEAPRPTRHGSTRPWRSERRPKYGLIDASSAPDATNVAPIPAADAPSSSSRSGASTSSVPNISPTRITIHIPVAIRGSLRPASTLRIGVCGGGWVGRREQRPHQQAAGGDGDRREDDLGAEPRRGGAEHRPEQRADDRGAHRRADQLAAALARRGADQPAERARPRRRRARAPGRSARCRARRCCWRTRT